jgi:hypothetical protein
VRLLPWETPWLRRYQLGERAWQVMLPLAALLEATDRQQPAQVLLLLPDLGTAPTVRARHAWSNCARRATGPQPGVLRALSYTSRMSPSTIKRIPSQAKPLTVRLDAALERRVHAAAAQEGVSLSDFVRTAITDRLNRGATDNSLWDQIAPSVVRRRPRSGRARGGPPKRQPSGHEEFAAGLEAEAAKKWRRLDE